MKKPTNFIFLALLAGGLLACNSNNRQDSVSAAREANDTEDSSTFRAVPDLGVDAGQTYDDADFAVQAAEAGLFEVQLGNIAADRAISQEVKDFAQQMIRDHGSANEEMAKLAGSKNIILPTALSRDNQEDLTKFNDLSADEFDQDYIERMIEDHDRNIKLFERASSQSKDDAIRAFATKQLPILKKHLAHARTIDEKQ